MKKKATPVTLDDLKNLIKETAEAMGGKLSQDDLDAFLTKYDLDDESAEENPRTLPPNSSIAASKLNLVLVLGSKNSVANFLCLHTS